MAGQALSLFAEFVNETGPTFLTSQEERVNDAQKRNYRTLGYLSRGQKMSEMLQGGQQIKDIIYLSATRTGRTYLPNEAISRTNKQTGTAWTVPWRFWENHIAYTDQEIELNDGASAAQLAQQYKRIWHAKQQELATDQANFQEELLWAVPDTTKMESATGQEPYSIPCFVNEFDNGLPSAAHPGGAWTTVQQINPTTVGQTNWVPQRFGYTASTTTTQALTDAFDKAWLSLEFQSPPYDKQYFESDTAEPINIVATSMQGRINLMKVYRANNDRWEDMKDPWFQPMYAGAPCVYVAQLDSAAIFPTGAAAALSTELDTAGTTNAGPRYFLLQPKYLRMVYKSGRFMKNLGEFTPPETPTSHFMPVDTWGNLVCRSRIRHGIIYPTADIGTAGVL